MSALDSLKQYYPLNKKVLSDIISAIFESIADSIDDAITYINSLTTVRQTGRGGQIWTKFWRIFLSGREEKNDFKFSSKATAIANDLFGGYDASKIDDPVTILDFEKALLSIHKARGTEKGITADIKRICNNKSIVLSYNDQTKCGWIGDVTSPELTPDLLYDPDNSLCYMDLDNMLIISAANSGDRGNNEIAKIIRHEFVPVKYNLKLSITNESYS